MGGFYEIIGFLSMDRNYFNEMDSENLKWIPPMKENMFQSNGKKITLLLISELVKMKFIRKKQRNLKKMYLENILFINYQLELWKYMRKYTENSICWINRYIHNFLNNYEIIINIYFWSFFSSNLHTWINSHMRKILSWGRIKIKGGEDNNLTNLW